jgi:hypothetical protein
VYERACAWDTAPLRHDAVRVGWLALPAACPCPHLWIRDRQTPRAPRAPIRAETSGPVLHSGLTHMMTPYDATCPSAHAVCNLWLGFGLCPRCLSQIHSAPCARRRTRVRATGDWRQVTHLVVAARPEIGLAHDGSAKRDDPAQCQGQYQCQCAARPARLRDAASRDRDDGTQEKMDTTMRNHHARLIMRHARSAKNTCGPLASAHLACGQMVEGQGAARHRQDERRTSRSQ